MSREIKANITIALLMILILTTAIGAVLIYTKGSVDRTNSSGVEVAQKVLPSSVYIVAVNQQDSQKNPMGSGIVYSSNGGKSIIVTAKHVLDGAGSAAVVDLDGNSYPATVVGIDAFTDSAVLSVNKTLAPIKIGDSRKLEVGQTVFAVGSPFGFRQTMTQGIISALHRDISDASGGFNSSYSLYDVLQTDAAINPGNSGGMLVDENGELIGMISAIWSESNGSVGLGFAVPSEALEKTVNQILKQGYAKHNYIGLQGVAINDSLRSEYNFISDHGVMVSEIVAGSPSATVLKTQDLILSANGHRIDTLGQLLTEVQRVDSGEKIKLEIERSGIDMDLYITVSERRYDQE